MVTQAVRGKKASLSLSELTWGAEKPLRGWVCLDLRGKELLTNLLQYLSVMSFSQLLATDSACRLCSLAAVWQPGSG